MSLELPPNIPMTLTGHPPGKDEYWQSHVGTNEISLALMKMPPGVNAKPATVVFMVEEIEVTGSRLAIDVLRGMRDEIERWVEVGRDVHTTLGIEVRINKIQIEKDSL